MILESTFSSLLKLTEFDWISFSGIYEHYVPEGLNSGWALKDQRIARRSRLVWLLGSQFQFCHQVINVDLEQHQYLKPSTNMQKLTSFMHFAGQSGVIQRWSPSWDLLWCNSLDSNASHRERRAWSWWCPKASCHKSRLKELNEYTDQVGFTIGLPMSHWPFPRWLTKLTRDSASCHKSPP